MSTWQVFTLFVISLHCVVNKFSKHPCQLPFYYGMQIVKHIVRVAIADHVKAIPISSIKEKCMRIDVDATHVYVCHIPNSFEKDLRYVELTYKYIVDCSLDVNLVYNILCRDWIQM